MTNRVRQILNEISALEGELRAALTDREHEVHFEIRGKRVRFERSVREAHLKLRKRLTRWLMESSLRAILSIPFIFAMVVPLGLLDASFTLYQAICFRLYRIARVQRADYIVVDRHHLAYLNSIEKLICVYCGYANGLIAYITEITARTEQYWCPIKHANKVLGSHTRYNRFLEFGMAVDYHEKLEQFRKTLEVDDAGTDEA